MRRRERKTNHAQRTQLHSSARPSEPAAAARLQLLSDLPGRGSNSSGRVRVYAPMRGDLWTTTTTCRCFPDHTMCVARSRPLKLRPLGHSARTARLPSHRLALARMRTLNISEQLLASELESKQRTKTFETGLLLAHHGAKVDTILRLVPTPSADSKSAATTLDADWMLAHAAQVSRMLPGGIVILGVYVLAPNAKLSSMEPKLQLLLGSLLKQLPPAGAESNPAALLLPIDAKKASCKALLPGGARLQPLEIKSTRTAAALHRFSNPHPNPHPHPHPHPHPNPNPNPTPTPTPNPHPDPNPHPHPNPNQALHCFTCDLALDVPLRLSHAQCAAGPAGAASGVLHAQLAPHLAALRSAVARGSRPEP